MRRLSTALLWSAAVCAAATPAGHAQAPAERRPMDHLPAHIRQLTHFADFPGYKATNGVVSDDGRLMAFQMGRAGDAPGIGHGVFVMDLTQAPAGP